ncbi:MAG: pseudouridine synthase [Leptolyngbyaceae cyanobacterium]
MNLLSPVAVTEQFRQSPPSYWYEGRCPKTGAWLQLPRTATVEAIARQLMTDLVRDDRFQQAGKMYGILLVTTPTGELGVLKAFSGLLGGHSHVPGWVPPIPGRAQVQLLEQETLQTLARFKQEIMALKSRPERAMLVSQSRRFAQQLATLSEQHRQNKTIRDRRRQTSQATLSGATLERALEELVRQSQHDGGERRRLKRQRDEVLQPLKAAIAQADAQISQLKRQRQTLSRELQAQMHAAYSLTNFAGQTSVLQSLSLSGLPTGTGDCAAPKLLHYAATHGLQPLALAEFWWGPATGDKQPGQFYGACVERCQPIMGFLLSGLSREVTAGAIADLPVVLYEDDSLLVIDKPAGLLSVPGRTSQQQDSVLSRCRCQFSPPYLAAPHRLDKGTSGILILAKSVTVHRDLGHQFAQRKIHKVYEAVLSWSIEPQRGQINLPLWRDPSDRPKTTVNFNLGKPSLTEFEVLEPGDRPRLRFIPHTGRTHQLRIHSAHPQGLNTPILGDTLYGDQDQTCRLHLHAQAIQFIHPVTGKSIDIQSPLPF